MKDCEHWPAQFDLMSGRWEFMLVQNEVRNSHGNIAQCLRRAMYRL